MLQHRASGQLAAGGTGSFIGRIDELLKHPPALHTALCVIAALAQLGHGRRSISSGRGPAEPRPEPQLTAAKLRASEAGIVTTARCRAIAQRTICCSTSATDSHRFSTKPPASFGMFARLQESELLRTPSSLRWRDFAWARHGQTTAPAASISPTLKAPEDAVSLHNGVGGMPLASGQPAAGGPPVESFSLGVGGVAAPTGRRNMRNRFGVP